MDAIFGPKNFRSELTWKRTHAHSDARQGRKGYGQVADILLYYSRSDEFTFNTQYTPYAEAYIDKYFRYRDADGRRYWLDNLTGPGGAAKGNPYYEVMGVSRYWRYSKEKMDMLILQGRIVQTKPGNVPQYKRYLDEMPGIPLQNIWTDIPPINMMARERLGYPTQKPETLLERIITASSNPGDVVLDPFCGCGTAVAAAQKLGRRWVGIDITHVAVGLMKSRLRDAFGLQENRDYKVTGEPTTLPDAQKLAEEDKFQFQAWALGKVGARNAESAKKGADGGIDGRLYFHEGDMKPRQVILSVKGGHLRADDIRALGQVVTRESADIGVLITMEEPTQPMRADAASGGFYKSPWGTHPRLQILTIRELLDGKKIDMPQTYGANITFRQAPRAKAAVGASTPSIWDAANGSDDTSDDIDELDVDEA